MPVSASLVGTANTRGGTLYRISVRSTAPAPPVTVLRALNEFKVLHAELGRATARPLPPLPIGILSSLFRRDALARMEALNAYLHALLASEALSMLPPLRRFLQEDAAEDAEHAATPAASSTLPALPPPPTLPAGGSLVCVCNSSRPWSIAHLPSSHPTTDAAIAIVAPALSTSHSHKDDVSPARRSSSPHVLVTSASGLLHGTLASDVLHDTLATDAPGTIGTSLCLIPEPRLTLQHALYQIRVSTLATGGAHALALCHGPSGAEVVSWGEGAAGQLGHGTPAAEPCPRCVDALSGLGVLSVACGGFHSIVLASSGRAYGFGASAHGQTGVGEGRNRLLPCAMPPPNLEEPAANSAAAPTAAADSLHALGYSNLAAGARHSVLVDTAGRAHACGCGALGQLGTGLDADEPTPRELTSLRGTALARCGAGEAHSVFVSRAGAVFTCGANESGQLGLGDTSPRHWPVLVAALSHHPVATVHVAGGMSLCVASTGHVFCLGDGSLSEVTPLTPDLGGLAVTAACIGADGRSVALVLAPRAATCHEGASVEHLGRDCIGDADDESKVGAVGGTKGPAHFDTAADEGRRSDAGGCSDVSDGGNGGGLCDELLGPDLSVADAINATDGDGSSSGQILHEGSVCTEHGWLRGARSCWLQLCAHELRILDEAPDGATSDASPSGGSVQRTIPLARVDAISNVGGRRLRLRLKDGTEEALLCASARAAHEWKAAVQRARAATPRRAFLQDAIGATTLATRGGTNGEEVLRWLCLAASWGETDEVCAMLRAGARVNAAHSTHQRTPLHYASLNGHAPTVEALLSRRADANARDADGVSALEAALEQNHVECALQLAAGGAVLTPSAEGHAMSVVGVAPGKLMASLRATQWQATKGVGLLGSPTAPSPATRARGLSSPAVLRKVEGAWRATLDVAPPPAGVLMRPDGTSAADEDHADPNTPGGAPLRAAFPSAAELRRMCEAGIPPHERRRAWPLLLSMHAPLLPTPAEYATLRDEASEWMAAATAQTAALSECGNMSATAAAAAVIATDLRRTFPSFGAFGDGGMMHSMLREVLWTYGAMADALDYRQGMSHLAAVLLLHVHHPPLACACLSALLAGYPILRACGARAAHHSRKHAAHSRTHAAHSRTRVGDEEMYTVCLRVRGPPRGTPEYRRRTLPSMAARARLTYASRRRLSPLAHSSAHARLVCSMD